MIRLLGAITGSALALAALLLFVGVPQFKAEPKDIMHAVVTLPLRAEPVDVEPLPVEPAHVEPPLAQAVLAEQTEDNAGAPKDIQDLANADMDVPSEKIAKALQPDSQQWYAFWSPFRSEIAASGFITQLQRVTGLDYRVVKIKPGVYEVAFAYAGDGDIPINLSQISAATGLDLPEG